MKLVNFSLFAAMLFSSVSFGADIHECDRLAANPPDPDRVTAGVPRKEVDLSAAIAACSAAIEAHPEIARFVYQLGRVSYYNGNIETAQKYIGKAAEMGYRQAEFVMGLLIENRRPGVPYDICAVEDYWYRSAVKEHLNARISYVRHVTKGRFAECLVQARGEELEGFIDIPASDAPNYLSRLLVEDLKEDVADYLKSE